VIKTGGKTVTFGIDIGILITQLTFLNSVYTYICMYVCMILNFPEIYKFLLRSLAGWINKKDLLIYKKVSFILHCGLFSLLLDFGSGY